MKRRSRLFAHVSAALLAASFLAGPASAQSGLGTRLDEAGQKLDSDTQNCRPVNLAEYAQLLQEAMANKQRAAKAAKKGVPVNQAQVDGDLAKASMLFARAQAAQAMQCMRAAQQQAQPLPQAQALPQQTGMAPGAPAHPQSISADDQLAVATQQMTIEDFEKDLDELQSLVKAGKCAAAWELVDDLDDWLDYLDGPLQAASAVSASYRPRVPGRLLDEWDDRITDLIRDCRRPGSIDYKQVRAILDESNLERSKYGLDPFRWSVRLQDHAQAYADQLNRAGEMSHASRDGRGTERENLSQGLPWWSVGQHLENWRKEKAKFKPGIFPDVSFTGNWYEVGHWTQWIWANSRAIGCGMAVGGVASWFVCRYKPGGNKDGVAVGIPAKPQVAGANPSSGDQATRATAMEYYSPSDHSPQPDLETFSKVIAQANTSSAAAQPRSDPGTEYAGSIYGSGFFYIPGQQSANSTVRPRPLGEPSESVNIGTSDGGPIEYVRIATLPQGSFNPYRYYSSPLISFNSVAAAFAASAQVKPAIDPVNSAFTQLAGFTFGRSNTLFGSDTAATTPEPAPKYGFDVSFGGGPDQAGNWQVGVQGFYSFGEIPQTIYIDTNVMPPGLPGAEVFVRVPPNTPLDIM